jgi:4,5-dihydroxyphthalate decarboxylase
MSLLPITIATWDYDRVRPLVDGRVRIEGCDVNYITMPVEECFERAYFHGEFEVAEIGFSPYLIALSRGTPPYVAVPAFLSRMFRHSAVYIRTDRGINGPADLKGKRVGVPEYQMSAVLWFRGFLQDEFGIAANDINWVQGGLENPGRREKFPLNLLPGFPLTSAPAGQTLSQMLADGALDAVMAARRPSVCVAGHPKIRRLFPDYRAAERAYFQKTGLFPIMHAVGIRRDVHAAHPWLAASVYKAFVQAKRLSDAEFAETTALKVGLPWVNAEYDETRTLMGDDFWSYGLNEANRRTLATMARYSYEQGLAVRLLDVDEMFAESTRGDETRV